MYIIIGLTGLRISILLLLLYVLCIIDIGLFFAYVIAIYCKPVLSFNT